MSTVRIGAVMFVVIFHMSEEPPEVERRYVKEQKEWPGKPRHDGKAREAHEKFEEKLWQLAFFPGLHIRLGRARAEETQSRVWDHRFVFAVVSVGKG